MKKPLETEAYEKRIGFLGFTKNLCGDLGALTTIFSLFDGCVLKVYDLGETIIYKAASSRFRKLVKGERIPFYSCRVRTIGEPEKLILSINEAPLLEAPIKERI